MIDPKKFEIVIVLGMVAGLTLLLVMEKSPLRDPPQHVVEPRRATVTGFDSARLKNHRAFGGFVTIVQVKDDESGQEVLCHNQHVRLSVGDTVLYGSHPSLTVVIAGKDVELSHCALDKQQGESLHVISSHE